MNQEKILAIIKTAISACENKDALKFASLFAENGKISLKDNFLIEKSKIPAITEQYFAELEYIKIDIYNIKIEENKAFISWLWQDFNFKKQQKNCHENIIYLEFEENLIILWQELTSCESHLDFFVILSPECDKL